MRIIDKEKVVNKNIPVIFQELERFEKEDSRFLRMKIWLVHTGLNRNNSIFTRDGINKALPSLSNTPILAYIEENSEGDLDYSDHRSVLERKDGDIAIKYLGKAVGIIPETNNAKWETRVSDSGEELEYLTVEGLMWTKWDSSVDIIKRKQKTAQSMEIIDTSGYWNENGQYVFEEFKFFGACLLGDDVQPAMKNSTAELQFSINGDMQKDIENKLNEFYTLFSQQEGGQEMTEENQTQEEVVVEEATTEEETATEETFETETQSETTDEVQEEVVEQPVAEDEAQEEFEVATITKETTEVETTTIETEGDTSVADLVGTEKDKDGKEEVEVIDFEVKYNDLSTQFEQLQSELNELKSFKRQVQENELKAKFDGQLDSDELTAIFNANTDKELDVIEGLVFAEIGKKNFSMKREEVNTVKVTVDFSKQEENTNNPYGSFFD